MPDHDIFDRNSRRGWSTPARMVVLNDEFDDGFLHLFESAMIKELQANQLPGFVEVIDLAEQAIKSGQSIGATDAVLSQLDSLERRYDSRSMRNLISSVRKIIFGNRFDRIQVQEEGLAHQIAVLVVSQLADQWMFPAIVLAELVVDGVPHKEIESRRQRAIGTMENSPEARSIVSMLLDRPVSTQPNFRRRRQPRMSQEQLLSYAISD